MLRAALVALAALAAMPAYSQTSCTAPVTAAEYGAPTGRYPHGVLGDALEWGSLRVTCGGATFEARLPDQLVFEDVAPRLADLDADGAPEIVVVESHRDQGARLAVWTAGPDGIGRIAATPFIGTRFRWLSPVGVADLDGDGAMELAYVDRPHLARVLRVWRYADGQLAEIATAAGYTNHRIGEADIAGGIRTCGGRPEMVLATSDWKRIHAVTLTEGGLTGRDIGAHEGRASFRRALACR